MRNLQLRPQRHANQPDLHDGSRVVAVGSGGPYGRRVEAERRQWVGGVDSSGNNNNGTWHGTPSGYLRLLLRGKQSDLGQFDGSTDYISSSANSGISGMRRLRWRCGLNAEDASSFRGVAGVSGRVHHVGSGGHHPGGEWAGSVSAEFAGDNGARTAAGVITAGQWYHIAVVKTPDRSTPPRRSMSTAPCRPSASASTILPISSVLPPR